MLIVYYNNIIRPVQKELQVEAFWKLAVTCDSV